jgi:hypothetical protein
MTFLSLNNSADRDRYTGFPSSGETSLIIVSPFGLNKNWNTPKSRRAERNSWRGGRFENADRSKTGVLENFPARLIKYANCQRASRPDLTVARAFSLRRFGPRDRPLSEIIENQRIMGFLFPLMNVRFERDRIGATAHVREGGILGDRLLIGSERRMEWRSRPCGRTCL